jgi:hypothetical protein
LSKGSRDAFFLKPSNCTSQCSLGVAAFHTAHYITLLPLTPLPFISYSPTTEVSLGHLQQYVLLKADKWVHINPELAIPQHCMHLVFENDKEKAVTMKKAK